MNFQRIGPRAFHIDARRMERVAEPGLILLAHRRRHRTKASRSRRNIAAVEAAKDGI